MAHDTKGAMTVMAVATSAFDGVYNEGFIPQNFIGEALIFTQSTLGPTIEGDAVKMHIPYVSTPVAAAIVAEGSEIAEDDPGISELLVTTRKVSVLTAVSNEAKANEGVQDMLTDSLNQSVVDKADAVFLQNDDQPTGLFNTDGIHAGGTVTDSLEPIVTALGAVSDKGGVPTALIMNYGTWAMLLNMHTTTGEPYINPTVANSPTPMLFGLPVILNRQAPTGKILVNSKTEVMASYGKLKVSSTEHRYFERDATGMRVTFRFGFGVLHPERLAVLTVTPAE